MADDSPALMPLVDSEPPLWPVVDLDQPLVVVCCDSTDPSFPQLLERLLDGLRAL